MFFILFQFIFCKVIQRLSNHMIMIIIISLFSVNCYMYVVYCSHQNINHILSVFFNHGDGNNINVFVVQRFFYLISFFEYLFPSIMNIKWRYILLAWSIVSKVLCSSIIGPLSIYTSCIDFFPIHYPICFDSICTNSFAIIKCKKMFHLIKDQ